MSAHTPGPWNAELFDDGSFDVSCSKGGILGGHYVVCSRSLHCMVKTTHADARLISAAPDLLAALEAALTVLPDSVGAFDWFAARAAIAKARGAS